MKVLAADDSPMMLALLRSLLAAWGYRVVTAVEGDAAWAELQGTDPPQIAVLDWDMPGLTGPEICRRMREAGERPFYLILLSGKETKDDIVTGLAAGADDYLTKPFHHEELRARLRAGQRIVELQLRLAERIQELEQALAEVKQLRGIIPICMYCKRVRNDENFWLQVERYVSDRTEAQFSHGICPECYQRVVQPQLDGEANG